MGLFTRYDPSFVRNLEQAQRWAAQYPLGAYYRLEEVQYASSVNEDGDTILGSGRVEVQVHVFEVLRHTPTGTRINDYQTRASGKGRFISRNWGKQWACPTIDAAIKSFVARKTRQIGIYKARIARAEEALDLVNRYATTEN